MWELHLPTCRWRVEDEDRRPLTSVGGTVEALYPGDCEETGGQGGWGFYWTQSCSGILVRNPRWGKNNISNGLSLVHLGPHDFLRAKFEHGAKIEVKALQSVVSGSEKVEKWCLGEGGGRLPKNIKRLRQVWTRSAQQVKPLTLSTAEHRPTLIVHPDPSEPQQNRAEVRSARGLATENKCRVCPSISTLHSLLKRRRHKGGATPSRDTRHSSASTVTRGPPNKHHCHWQRLS